MGLYLSILNEIEPPERLKRGIKRGMLASELKRLRGKFNALYIHDDIDIFMACTRHYVVYQI